MCENHAEPENWLPVIGYDGYYEVSDHGHVRSVDRFITQDNSHGTGLMTRLMRGRMLCELDNGSGYKQVSLSMNGLQDKRYIHDLVLITFTGNRPDGMEACHGSLGQSCNATVNLEWNLGSVNRGAHKRRDGTLVFGESNWNAKLTDEIVRVIYRRVKTGEAQKSAGLDFGVSQATVCDIMRGKTWKHLNLEVA